ncbi:MAG: lipoate--protein ligase [Ruminococcaceae bacterium]|nr:lipoate--protein ligase [Oscillospiraceae bacterium]
MKLLRLHTVDPYRNLAIEEYLFRHATDDTFLLWQNDRTVVIGKNQNPYVELDLNFIREAGIRIARRITGGGAVYHDMGNVNFTFISPKGKADGIDFAAYCTPIVKALRTLGATVLLSGRNDLLLDGKKISGNAQHAFGGRVLHHGTLLYDSDLTVLSRALRPDEEKLRAKAVRSVSSRVTNLRPYLPTVTDTEALMDALFAAVGGEWMSLPNDAEIDALTARNASQEWLFPEREMLCRYARTRKIRYLFGTVEILLDMEGERVRDLRISGDFFGISPVAELENLLRHTTRAEAKARLCTLCLADYIHGMTAEALLAQIFDTQEKTTD